MPWNKIGDSIKGDPTNNSGFSISISNKSNISTEPRIAISSTNYDSTSPSGVPPFNVGVGGIVRVYDRNSAQTTNIPIGYTQIGNNINDPSITPSQNYFGHSISLNNGTGLIAPGTVLAVGSPGDSVNGKVYIYLFDGTGWGIGPTYNLPNFTIIPPTPGSFVGVPLGKIVHNFGYSIALSDDGNTLVIGSPDSSVNTYTTFVYVFNGVSWVPIPFTASDVPVPPGSSSGLDGNFGFCVSINGDGTIVSTSDVTHNPSTATNTGRTVVYEKLAGISPLSLKGTSIVGEAQDNFSGFRNSLDISGNYLVIGAIGNSDNYTGSGTVKVYIYDGTINNWVKLGGDIDGEGAFSANSAVSISTNSTFIRVAIGGSSNLNEHSVSGYTRVYEYDASQINNSPQLWKQIGQDINGVYNYDFFGWNVVLSRDGGYVIASASLPALKTGPLFTGLPLFLPSVTYDKDKGYVNVYQLTPDNLGLIGPTGPMGPTGPSGGPTGPTGPTGPFGSTGSIGPMGPIGPTGPTGPKGIDGIDGVNGIDGIDGIDGAIGPTGPSGGPTGPAGIDGIDGLDGIDGATGPTGPIGLTGSTGARGRRGRRGLKGNRGKRGYTGKIDEESLIIIYLSLAVMMIVFLFSVF